MNNKEGAIKALEDAIAELKKQKFSKHICTIIQYRPKSKSYEIDHHLVK